MSGGDNTAHMTAHAFIKKWKKVDLTERQTAHEHFLDLCKLLDHPTPIQDDPIGDHFAFEKGATKIGGGKGFADVWKRDHFAWEYKRKNGDLDAALLQLMRYAPALESPPLQVVCDTDRFRIHTAWTNTVPERHELKLEDLADPQRREILRNVFHDPEKLRPTKTRAGVTKEAADKFSTIANKLKGRASPEGIAHFVNQLVFCFFADSVKLLPDGLFKKLLKRAAENKDRTENYLNQLFGAMEIGGDFDLNDIAWFNGGLFDGRKALPLDDNDVGLLVAAGSLDWGQIDPTIFGTLFERFLDPDKRAQIGAHYTDADKILKIIDPVILAPLREEWLIVKAEMIGLLNGTIKPPMRSRPRRPMKPVEAAEETRSRFLERLRGVRILDPACGSGNFLYLALQGVKDIENIVNLESEMLGLAPRLPVIGPEIVHGIEINPLAAELARTTIWIGDIQWRLRNGIYAKPRPILRKLDAIECRDALLAPVNGDSRNQYIEAAWPKAEFIVGNPPFLGTKKMIAAIGESYAASLRTVFKSRLSPFSDLVCWWFDKAYEQIQQGNARRAGFVATNSISGGRNRLVLDKIVSDLQIFEAWSDEPWIVEGAAVRVAIIAFAKTNEPARLDGKSTNKITSELRASNAGGSHFNPASVGQIASNRAVAFIGTMKNGDFNIPGTLARSWLMQPLNPNGRPNSDVLFPWFNGSDLVRRPSDQWVIDFGERTPVADAVFFEAPFERVRTLVKPNRDKLRRKSYREIWWLYQEPQYQMRRKIRAIDRFIATPRVSKYRLFVWKDRRCIPDSATVAIARNDDTTFGILHSRFHEQWSLRLCTWLGVGNDPRYTPTTTFETFPFPEGLTPDLPAHDYASDPHAVAIAIAAKRLDELRSAWLNPRDLIDVLPEVVAGYPERIIPKTANAAVELKKRTLTNLYNLRPQWLVNAHRDLDDAVASAYGWPVDISDDEALARLLSLNLDRAREVTLDLGDNGKQHSPSIIPR